MRSVVLGMSNAVRCEIWCYGDMVIWPALQARAFALVLLYLIVVRFVVVRHTRKILPIVHAAAGARACPSNGIWRISISISGTRNRSEIMESCVVDICMYCTIDYPGVCTNNPAC